jgi:predicted regulator of Ras-like GTPase activity (Roadblock/LC7/MglB family)
MVKRVNEKTLIIEVNRDIIFDIIAHSNIGDLPLKKIKLINYVSWFT